MEVNSSNLELIKFLWAFEPVLMTGQKPLVTHFLLYYLLRNKRTRYDRKKLMNFLGGSGGYATKKLPKLSEGSFIAGGTHF